ncbi:MAG: aminotransferase class V-fold PLP-dependent enzyme [Flavipsychrobacter sp.]|nr:aminotransferase class V-fold PLP-dependent enzyme [Flavipsychrobacter sp.]
MAQTTYLNTAGCGLIAPEALAAGNALYEAFTTNSSTASEEWRFNEEQRTRELMAAFIGANANNVALVPNFSWALNAVVQSLKGTERVLLYKGDYPSLLEPFRINNFAITWVDAPDGFHIDMDAVRSAVTNRTVDIVAISHVQWNSAFRIDLKDIGDLCHKHGVVFIVDATQSLGAITIDLSQLNTDVLISSHYKWMNAGFGNGTLYIADAFMQQYPPVVGGHNSYHMVADKWMYVPSIKSYEPGSPNMYGYSILAAEIERKNQMGLAAIEAHNRQLTDLFLRSIADLKLTVIGDLSTTHRASFVLLRDDNGLGAYLKDNGFVVTVRNGLVRISFHYYNTEPETVRLIDCLSSFSG